MFDTKKTKKKLDELEIIENKIIKKILTLKEEDCIEYVTTMKYMQMSRKLITDTIKK